MHTIVARSTFPSQNVQNTKGFGPLLEVEMFKSARHCGAKHISKSKFKKHTILRPLLELEMSKKCTPLWREGHFQVKMYKARRSDVEKVHAIVARSKCPSQECKKTQRYGPLFDVQMSNKC